MGNTPGWRARGYSAPTEGGENRSILEIQARMTSLKNQLKVDRLSTSDWERVLASYPQHSFFSRPEWYKAFEESFPGRYQSHFIHCHNSQLDVFVPCMTEKWKYGLCSLVSSPMSGTSGVFCTASTL